MPHMHLRNSLRVNRISNVHIHKNAHTRIKGIYKTSVIYLVRNKFVDYSIHLFHVANNLWHTCDKSYVTLKTDSSAKHETCTPIALTGIKLGNVKAWFCCFIDI